MNDKWTQFYTFSNVIKIHVVLHSVCYVSKSQNQVNSKTRSGHGSQIGF